MMNDHQSWWIERAHLSHFKIRRWQDAAMLVRSPRPLISELVVHAHANDVHVCIAARAVPRDSCDAGNAGTSNSVAVVVAEIGIQIFDLGGPVVGEGIFHARAQRPADATGVAATSSPNGISRSAAHRGVGDAGGASPAAIGQTA